MIICLSILLRMRNVSDNSCRGNKKAHIFSKVFSENCDVYEMSKNVEPDATDDSIIWCMRIECWIAKVADTRICNAFCFSTAKILARTRPSVTLYEGWNFNSGNYLFTTDTK